ncbi:MAG: glycosyltransferase [Limnospira sp.]
MQCKICASPSLPFGQTTVLNRYPVNYFQCQHCGFVQTEEPHWLSEAYDRAIASSDDGLVFRNLMLAQLSSQIIAQFFNPGGRFLDYGGGYGLFVRLMREIRFQFDWCDRFCDNLFAAEFEGTLTPEKPYELITAFELFEHLKNPLDDIRQLLTLSPNILFSTELLPPHNPKPGQWWYYAPQSGQHISFYTPKSLQIIAEQLGLNIYSNGSSLHLLTKKILSPEQFAQFAQYDAAELRKFLQSSRSYRQTLERIERQSQPPEMITPNLGVNVAGFVNGEFGIGEGVRATLRGMEAANLPVAINNFTGSPHRKQDTSFQNFTSENPHPVNLIQINANDVMRFAKIVGSDYFKNRYNIGFWAWELPEFPPEWMPAFSLFHEIWTYSDYCVSAISQVSPIPVIKMMPTVSLPPATLTREQLGLPRDEFIFLFMFDFYSRMERKNPLAVVEAFKIAFGNHPQNIRLVLKCSNSNRFPQDRSRLLNAIADSPAISIIDRYLSREEINSLVFHCNAYISLHRSEGFGLTMAEAMFHGKPVIATGYSSNTEFMNLANSFLVKYRRILIAKGDGPYQPGNLWADPDIRHAAELMKFVVENPEATAKIGSQAAADIRTLLSPEAVGDRILNRLQTIQAATDNFTRIAGVANPSFVTSPTPPPLVSICIPTYNGEAFISEAIASAFSQTYSNCEIILADDGSTDRTVAIAESWKSSSPVPFRIFTHINYGLVDNLNFCISQANGKYLKFLFQDDRLEPNCIEELVSIAASDPNIGLVFSRRDTFIDPQSASDPQCQAAYKGTRNLHQDWSTLKAIQDGSELLSDPNCFRGRLNKIGEPTTVLLSRSAVSKLGGFDPDLHQFLDVDLWFRIMGDYKIGFVDKPLSGLRIHRHQQTQRNIARGQNLRDYGRLYRKIIVDPDYRFLSLSVREQILQQLWVKSPRDYLDLSRTLAEQYRQNPSHQPSFDNLRLLRKVTATMWLNLDRDRLEKFYHSPGVKINQIIRDSGIIEMAIADGESELLERIKLQLSRGFTAETGGQFLLAAMLYRPAYQLPLHYQNAIVPHYLFDEFIRFLFSPVREFNQVGDIENYVNFVGNIWNDLKRNIQSHSNNGSLWVYVAKIALELWDGRLLMNVDRDIESILRDRDAVLDFYLKAIGHKIDYNFDKNNRQSDNKISVGILIDNLCLKDEILAILAMYEKFNCYQFDMILYFCTIEDDNLGAFCASRFTRCVTLPPSLPERVQTLRRSNLDVAVIASDVTAEVNSYCQLARHRLAPVQVHAAGSPEMNEDPDDRAMPDLLDSPWFARSQPSPQIQVTRRKLGVSEQTAIFLSGVEWEQVTPEMRATWAKILMAVPESILVVVLESTPAQNPPIAQVRSRWSRDGLDLQRIRLLPNLSVGDMQNCLTLADIYLDPFPQTGGLSLLRALKSGIPAVVREGKTARSRRGAALLRALDLPDAIAADEQSYINRSVRLGTEPDHRRACREQIGQNVSKLAGQADTRTRATQLQALFNRWVNSCKS